MKLIWSLRTFCIALATMALPFLSPAQESPNSVAGWTFDFTITSGKGAMAKAGKYRMYVNDATNVFSIRNIWGIQDEDGPISSLRTGYSLGRFVFPQKGYGNVLTFKASRSGTYVLGNSFNQQWGNFVAYSGNAPSSLGKKIFQMTAQTGSGPFNSSGNFRLITYGDHNYALELPGGGTNTSFSSSKATRSTAQLFFTNDLKWGPSGFIAFTFASATNGVYLSRAYNGAGTLTGAQTGAFTMSNFVTPTFVTHPTNRTVLVGDDTSFQARVNGTGPMKLQWYKDGNPITNATSTNYTIGFVEQAHAGQYWLVAQNLGGRFESLRATLTPKCDFTLEPSQAAFGSAGGTGQIAITAVGTCQWTVSNSVPWITVETTNGGGFSTNYYTVEENTNGVARFGSFTIGGKTFIVTQTGDFAPDSMVGNTLKTVSFTNRMVHRFVTSSNAYVSLPQPGTNALTSMSYTYAKNGHDTAELQTTGSAWLQQSTQLTFTSPSSGTFVSTHTNYTDWDLYSVEMSIGNFTLNKNEPDLNGDLLTDLVLQNTNGAMASWLMNGTNFLKSASIRKGTSPGANWRAVGMNDFDFDGGSDILLQDSKTRKLSIWLMQGTNLLRGISVRNGTPPAAGWKAIALADFNNDHSRDIVFQHDNRTVMIWFMNGTNYMTAAVLRDGIAANPGWRLALAGDFNDDGQSDLVWQHTNGQMAVWYFIGLNYVNSAFIRNGSSPGAAWRLAGLADFNFDTRDDLLLQNTNGKLLVWHMNGTQFLSSTMLRNGVSAGTWKVFGPK